MQIDNLTCTWTCYLWLFLPPVNWPRWLQREVILQPSGSTVGNVGVFSALAGYPKWYSNTHLARRESGQTTLDGVLTHITFDTISKTLFMCDFVCFFCLILSSSFCGRGVLCSKLYRLPQKRHLLLKKKERKKVIAAALAATGRSQRSSTIT